MLVPIIVLLLTIRSSYQAVYSCNPKAVCGCSVNPISINRIVGGENASPATWGWVVSIAINNSVLCSGSILSGSWIITAAHCVSNHRISPIIVYAGSTIRWSSTQSRNVSRVIVHPNYSSVTYSNDIALLQLSSALIMTDANISSICLPSVYTNISASNEFPSKGTTVIAIGWGRLSENGQLSLTLQQVTLTTIDYQSFMCNKFISDQKIQMCAGVTGGGKDTCQGDSGGPLMMFTSSKQWILVGITSFGQGCARPSNAAVYTRVAAYERWITINTNDSDGSGTSSSYGNTLQSSIDIALLFILLIIHVAKLYF